MRPGASVQRDRSWIRLVRERDQISECTRPALAAAKDRRIVLSTTGPRNLNLRNEQRKHEAHAHPERLLPALLGFKAQDYPVAP